MNVLPVADEWYDGGTRVLENGLTLWAKSWPAAKMFGIALGVNVGSVEDSLDHPGTAHCFEHIPWRGAGSYPSKLALVDRIEEHGGTWNAWTARDATLYWLHVDRDDFDHALNVLHAIVRAPRYEGLEMERTTILREYWMHRLTPDRRASMEFPSLFFRDPRWGRNIIGTEESIQSMCAENLRAFHAQWYTPGRMVVTAVGPLETNDLLDRLAARFGELPGAGELPVAAPSPEAVRVQTGCRVVTWDLDATYLTFDCPGPASRREEITASVICNMLGAGTSSPVFQRLREECGYFYDFGLIASLHRGFCTMGFEAQVSLERADACKEDFWTLVSSDVGLTQRRWEWVQECAQFQYLHAPFMARVVAETAAEDVLRRGRVLLRNECLTDFRRITRENVLAFSAQYFMPEQGLHVLYRPA